MMTVNSHSDRGLVSATWSRARKQKVKSGCRTCKLRKVKCDEGRPVCNRCHSTGRTCDGYGVWGGGGNSYGSRQQKLSLSTNRTFFPMPVLVENEFQYFDWYHCRTRTKIPGLFTLSFWTTTLVQSSLTEPAVLHAVLTLSSVHKSGVFLYANRGGNASCCALNENEQFILQHYTKAICHLQSHLSSSGALSTRIALITCAVFVCLEVLRGRFGTAMLHLKSGLKVLSEIEHQSGVVDESVVQIFSRLSIQRALLQQTLERQDLLFFKAGGTFPCDIFHNFNEAWQWMESILYKILRLGDVSRQQQSLKDSFVKLSDSLIDQQRQITTELAHWLKTYEASRSKLRCLFRNDVEAFGCQLLYCYHNIAEIMSGTSLRTKGDESLFDSYNAAFFVIINRLVTMANMRRPELSTLATTTNGPSPDFNMSRSVIDIGWIPILYYVAIKCRVHRLRLQAIKLLESSAHREGIWDAQMSACIARKVVEIEERDFYRLLGMNDEFSLVSSPNLHDLSSLPPLPHQQRVYDVKVILPNSPTDSMFLSCMKRNRHRDCEMITKEYSILLQKWLDS